MAPKQSSPSRRVSSPERTESGAAAASSKKKSVVMEFGIDMLGSGGGKGVARRPDGKKPGMHDRPWRKSAAAAKEEREKTAQILGGTSGGTDLGCVQAVMAAQEMLNELTVADGGEAVNGLQSRTHPLAASGHERATGGGDQRGTPRV